jgi:hypothetical protein
LVEDCLDVLVEYRCHIVHVIHGVDPCVDGTPFSQSCMCIRPTLAIRV